jgi:N-acyl homoserine lactone hydrolase
MYDAAAMGSGLADEKRARRLWALPGAEITIDRSLLVEGGAAEPITIPAPCFLIEHGEGMVLFDTGLNPEAAGNPMAYYPELAGLPGVRFTREQAVDAGILSLGFRPEAIRHVVLSHAHLDHTGGLKLFPEAKIHVFRGEIAYLRGAPAEQLHLYKLSDLAGTEQGDWREYDHDTDLLGDGSLVFFKTPGHTIAEGTLLVRLPNRNILLTGDTVHLREALEREAPMPFDLDKQEAVRSIQRLKRLAIEHNAEIWMNHDRETWGTGADTPAGIA